MKVRMGERSRNSNHTWMETPAVYEGAIQSVLIGYYAFETSSIDSRQSKLLNAATIDT